MRCFLVAILVVAGLAAAATAEDPPFTPVDYDKLPRTITREPEYVADPLYALFLFGPAGKTRMWAVLDKTRPDLAYHDVLYLDRNSNGDLTEPGERLVGKYSKRGARAGMALVIRVPRLPVPGTRIMHTDFLVSTVRKKGRKGIWFRMKWCGKTTLSGGYGVSGMDTTQWAVSPARAPVFRPTVRGPFSFAFWGKKTVTLPAGGSGSVSILVGSRGSGPDTLAVVDDHFLDLEREELTVTLIARAAAGRELRTRTRITGHC
jgi:hypothetical protein